VAEWISQLGFYLDEALEEEEHLEEGADNVEPDLLVRIHVQLREREGVSVCERESVCVCVRERVCARE